MSLRQDPHHGTLLRQPPLPDLSAGQDQGLARDPDRSPAAVSLFPAHLHGPGWAARLVRRHQRIAYAALFEASSAAIKNLATNPRFFGTRCGFFGVLHTWGRTLEYHPHVHYVVPGGGLSDDGTRWLPSRADFFLPVKALSILFRAKFRDALDRAGCWRRSIRRYGGKTG